MTQTILRFVCTAALCLAISDAAFAVTLKTGDVIPWNINQLPLYGGVTKTQAMLNKDNEFRDKVLRKIPDARMAATGYVDQAWNAYEAHQLNVAIEDANAAYLLNPQDDRIYWVMAAAQRERGASDEAEALYVKALTLSEEHRTKITEEYDGFHNGQELVHVDNATTIVPQYMAARKQLIGQ
jgi:tetratricopeptide (TPR) repeat protein